MTKPDLVIDSRLKGRLEPGAMHAQAVWGNRLACFLMRWFFGARFSELPTGQTVQQPLADTERFAFT
jgi:hypothetical protein